MEAMMNTKKLDLAISEFTKKKKSNAAYYEENWAEQIRILFGEKK